MNPDLNKILEIGSPPQVSLMPDLPVTPEKLGGWLWLPAIGLVLNCIIIVVDIVISVGYMPRLEAPNSGVLLINLITDCGFLIFVIYTATRFFGRRCNAPRLMIALFITGIVINGLLLMLSASVNAEAFVIEYGKGLLKGIAGSAIWIPYFCVSKRVKNTFLIP